METRNALVATQELRGLTSSEAAAGLAQYGSNQAAEERTPPLLALLGKFWAPVPWMLELTVVLELLLGRHGEAAIIGALLVLNAGIGLLQEKRAQSALSLLRQRLEAASQLDAAPALQPGPNWEDFVHLTRTEIRHCGAGSVQVMRRLRSMLEDLMVLPVAFQREHARQGVSALLTPPVGVGDELEQSKGSSSRGVTSVCRSVSACGAWLCSCSPTEPRELPRTGGSPSMLTLHQPLGCMQCQVRSVIARLMHKPFRFCHRCEYEMRQVKDGWNAWGQTVAGAPKQGASNPPGPARPSAPGISDIASPFGAPTRKASPGRSEAVEWRD